MFITITVEGNARFQLRIHGTKDVFPHAKSQLPGFIPEIP